MDVKWDDLRSWGKTPGTMVFLDVGQSWPIFRNAAAGDVLTDDLHAVDKEKSRRRIFCIYSANICSKPVG